MGAENQFLEQRRPLLFAHADNVCRELQLCYAGLRFNRIQLSFPPAAVLRDQPSREDVDVLFNLSGAAKDLVRHGFAVSAWWPLIPDSGVLHNCSARGFAAVWEIVRTRGGYRLRGASYADGMAKVTVALFPSTWNAVTVSAPKNPDNRRSH